MRRRHLSPLTIVLGLYSLLGIFSGRLIASGEKYGEACDHDVGPFWGMQCDTQQILTCRNGTCLCAHDWMIFNDEHSMCLTPPGKQCGSENYWILECVPNADCVGDSDDSKPQICQCQEGFVPTPRKDCNTNQLTDPTIQSGSLSCCPPLAID